ncbi:hypothetical protein ACIQI7_21820 [Kitasatospora sp. NPDC092039]|uniref:hypothetical protein n=1 Tax=Kitasatospora sp. NPDC092039 TaxID=3364086 RepID=UPI00381E2B75
MTRSTYMARGQNPVTWVTKGYPSVLVGILDKHGGLPRTVPPLVHHELNGRTPAQLRERIERRWYLHYARLSKPELAARADLIAEDLVRPGDCPEPRCEDGWLLDPYDTSCGTCSRGRTEVHHTGQDEVVDGPRSAPENVARVAAGIRARMRSAHGAPRGERSRHVLRKDLQPHVPAPYAREPETPSEQEAPGTPPRWSLREPEPDLAAGQNPPWAAADRQEPRP